MYGITYERDPSFATEDGLYYLKDVDTGGFMLYGNLMYIDYATKQETFLCSDSSCNHENERCSSYMANSDLYATNGDSQLFVYNDSLYFLSMEEMRENNISHGGMNTLRNRQELYRMNLDGSGRELVYTFDKDLAVEIFAVGDGNALWFYVKSPTVDFNEETKWYFYGFKERSLIKLDLSDYSIVEQIPLYKYEEIPSIKLWDCSDSRVIFCGQEFPEGITNRDVQEILSSDDHIESSAKIAEISEKSQMVYFAVNLSNKEIKEIFRHPFEKKHSGYTEGEYAYFTNVEERSTVRVNLSNGEQSEFFQAEGYVPVGKIGLGGKYECRSVNKDDDTVYFIDMTGGELTSTAARSLIDPEDSIMLRVRAFGKDKVLVCTGETSFEVHYGSVRLRDYSVISSDDFYNGRENYEPVKMIRVGVEAKYDENRT